LGKRHDSTSDTGKSDTVGAMCGEAYISIQIWVVSEKTNYLPIIFKIFILASILIGTS
jgi:hypothetical protein